jgi:hypothetical protein
MITIDKWAGLVTNASPYSIPPGAATKQVNLQVIAPGKVTVRPGLAAVSLSAVSLPIRSSIRYPGVSDRIVFQTSDGAVYVTSGVT